MPEPTPNLGLERPDFNVATWHDEVNGNFTILDSAIFGLTGIVVEGVWLNGTAYSVGSRVVDPDLGSIWTCVVAHTSAVAGSFADDRTANPTYWEQLTAFPILRGAWANSTGYAVGDQVYDETEGVIAICLTSHTSNGAGTIRDDEVYWVFVVDIFTTLGLVVRLALYAGGILTSGELLVRYIFPDSVDFPAGLTDSISSSIVATTSDAEFSIQKNGVEFGTITYSALGSTGVFTAASEANFVSGDILTIVAPSPADVTLSGVSITLSGIRNLE